MKKFILIFFLSIFIFNPGSISAQNKEEKVLKKPEGTIIGKLIVLEGNFMPGLGPAKTKAKEKIVPREVFLFTPAVNLKNVETVENIFYKIPGRKPFVSVKSDTKGNFSFKVPPGDYSIFTKEDGKYFANFFDGKGFIFPIKVLSGKKTKVEFRIDYLATF
ncbi:hypothetical protein ACFL35_12545 [Candidatus Riflebacteria bacterium]